MNVNFANGWGIVRTIADLALKQPEGKYVLMRDPNKVRDLRSVGLSRSSTHTQLAMITDTVPFCRHAAGHQAVPRPGGRFRRRRRGGLPVGRPFR